MPVSDCIMIGTNIHASTIVISDQSPMNPNLCLRKRFHVTANWLGSAGANRSCTLTSAVAIVFLLRYWAVLALISELHGCQLTLAVPDLGIGTSIQQVSRYIGSNDKYNVDKQEPHHQRYIQPRHCLEVEPAHPE